MATGREKVYPGIKRQKHEADLPPPNVNARSNTLPPTARN